MASAGVWLGHPDVRLPARSSGRTLFAQGGTGAGELAPRGPDARAAPAPAPLGHPASAQGPTGAWHGKQPGWFGEAEGVSGEAERRTLWGRRKGEGAGVSERGAQPRSAGLPFATCVA